MFWLRIIASAMATYTARIKTMGERSESRTSSNLALRLGNIQVALKVFTVFPVDVF